MEEKSLSSIKVSKRKEAGNNNNTSSKNASELFASCTFSSLGLHPTLCEQLKGNYLYVLMY